MIAVLPPPVSLGRISKPVRPVPSSQRHSRLSIKLRGGFSVETGSGSIYAEQTGAGDVKAETGSGSIELRDVHGGLHAETGSGSIKVAGTPSAPWKLETGSGGIELWTGNAPLTLDAETGSGGVQTDREMTTQGTVNHHHVTGKIGGGGPLVRIETGSGSIRVH